MVLLTHGGEADSDGRGLAHMFKHLGLAEASDVVSHLKVAKRACIMKEIEHSELPPNKIVVDASVAMHWKEAQQTEYLHKGFDLDLKSLALASPQTRMTLNGYFPPLVLLTFTG